MSSVPQPDVAQAQLRLLVTLLREGKSADEARRIFEELPFSDDRFPDILKRAELLKATTTAKLSKVEDPTDWRKECRSFGQLTKELPRFLIGGLVPAKALTAVCSPPFNG